MFTGLIQECAKVKSFNNNILSLEAKYIPKIGDSIAVNGACLTVTTLYSNGFDVELSKETRDLLALENYKNLVHIEPAMTLSSRLDGHIVQGHIDTVGKIIKIEEKENMLDFYIKCPKEFMIYIMKKGSITIDGVSLTVNDIFEDSFRLSIIPHTLKNTLFETYNINRTVNIETDIFAKQIAHIMNIQNKKNKMSWSDIDNINLSY
jgi:riboflavin synthase